MMTDTAFMRNPHDHRPSDQPDTLDYQRMALAVQALGDVLLELAKK